MRRKRTALDDSDEESQSDDSDDSICNTIPAVQKKATARKRIRAPGATRKNVQQDDSDDGGSSTRPNTPQNGLLSSEDDSGDDSDYVAGSATKRKPGGPSANNKRQKLQNGTLRVASPQPSTSQMLPNGTSQNAQNEDESDSSGSESADSDFGPFNERSLRKKKPSKAGKKLPQRTAKSKPSNYAGSNLKRQPVNSSQSKVNASHMKNSNSQPVNSSHLKMNASLRKGSKLNQTPAYDPSTDSQLVESLAQKVVYFLLIDDQKKYAIRRKAIVTHCFTDDYSPKLYIAVIKRANLLLKKNYGMELLQIENPKDCYLIINILRPELDIHEFVDLSRMKQQQYALISFLLTVIYMNENVITEDELSRCLKPLGIDMMTKNHPVFGDVKKYITSELVKQMYLNYECVSKDPPKYELTWGVRAKQEVDKRDLLQFVCTIMDDTSPEDWRMQYRDAEKEAETNSQQSSNSSVK